ncbi:Domain of unknown function DUF523 [Syntrophomonas zehnderi OL-4]|uniref:Uncharacterized protein n=1 Tax=Syntrophomonas zehnderi OL-4 TaxID=690567 RepID=A0A0E4C7E8_9FIRM|nr:DUF523 domain-containing protein [Syntrophomonas zehnderi]CFW96531.1 Domain of unknown function DUF523 [Syntrophomonas zehnderi OL-4]
MILISACLCGVNCKYNGMNNAHQEFLKLLKQGVLLPVCPEQLGGLTTPRAASEIQGGSGKDVLAGQAQVFNKENADLSSYFIKGAQETLRLAQQAGITEAIMQSRSPSCGCGKIYDGTFSGRLVEGDGVTSALLKKSGLKVVNDEEFLRNIDKEC